MKRDAKPSTLERQFLSLLEMFGEDIPEPENEYRFAVGIVGSGPGLRKRLEDARLKDWRFDFAWADKKIAVEIEGGVWARGRHTRGDGYTKDCEKYNAAQRHGWVVLRYTKPMLDAYPDGVVGEIRSIMHNRSDV